MADEEKKESLDKARDASGEAEVVVEVKESSDEQPQADVGVPTGSVGKETKEEAPAVEEKAAEEVVEKKSEKEEKPAPSGKFKDLIKEIESMTVSDLAELVKALEDRFGVSAAMPMVAPTSGAVGAPTESVGEEKSSYNVMLKDSGAQKIAVIKAVREINQDLGLKEAKDLVDGAPKEIKKDVPKADAEEAKKKLEAAGATAELV
ncbi:MAG: 50S ribosomal protein L7/L12 [bacterium]